MQGAFLSGSSINSKNKVFHIAALYTLRTKGELKEYFERKMAEGKNKMSVINVIRGKLIYRMKKYIKIHFFKP